MKDGKLKHKQGHCLGFTADLHLEKKRSVDLKKCYKYNLFFNISIENFSIFLEFYIIFFKNCF